MEMLEPKRLMTADVFTDGLQAVQQTLNGLSQHERFAESRQLIGESFGSRFSIGQLFGEDLVDPVLPAGDEATLIGLLESTAAANPDLTVTTSTQAVPGGEELRVEVLWDRTLIENQRDIDIDYTGLRDADLAVDVSEHIGLHATFGLTPVGEAREFFVEIHSLTAETELDNLTHSDEALRGFAGVDLSPITLQYAADLEVQFANPDGDAQDRLSRLELLGNSLHTLTEVMADAGNGVSLEIPLQVTIGSYSTAGTFPELSISSADPFASAEVPFEWNADAAELASFETVTPLDVVGGMSQISAWLPGLTEAEAFQQALPFAASRSIGDVVDIAQMYAEQVGSQLQSSSETTNFDSIQELAELLDATTLDYDPATNVLTIGWEMERDYSDAALLDVDFPLSSATDFLGMSAIAVTANANVGLNLGIDLTPVGEGFVLEDATLLSSLNGGLGVETEVGNDIQITLRNGTVHNFDLSGATSIGDVLDTLQVPGSLVTSVSGSGQSLVLNDLTTGESTFMVDFFNDGAGTISLAAGWLGIWGPDIDHDGQIAGVALHGDRLFDHFFVESGTLGGSIQFSGDNLEAGLNILGFDALLGEGAVSLNASFGAAFADPGTDAADGRISINELGSAVTSDITSLVPNESVTFMGDAALGFEAVDIPVLPDGAFGEAPMVQILVPDVLDLSSAEVIHNLEIVDVPLLTGQDVLDALEDATDLLDELQDLGALADNLPLINQRIRDFLDLAAPLRDAFAQLAPAGHSPASLEHALPDLLGINPDNFSLDHDEVNDVLNISLQYDPSELRTVPFDFNLVDLLGDSIPELPGISSIIDAGGEGQFQIEVGALIQLDMGIDLADPALTPFLYDSTSVALSVLVEDTTLDFQAAAGPLGLFVDGGSIVFDSDGVDGVGMDDPGTFTVSLNDSPNDRHSLGAAFGQASLAINAGAAAILPIAFPLETNDLSPDLSVSIPSVQALVDGQPDAITFTSPDLSDPIDGFDLLENLHLVVDGIDWMLGRVEDGLNSRVLNVSLPFIGDRLQNSAAFIGDLREGFLTELGDFLEMHPPTPATVQQAIFQYLGPGPDGVNILADFTDDGAITLDDVGYEISEAEDDVQFQFRLGRDIELAGGNIAFDVGLEALGLEVDADIVLDMFYEWDVAFGVSTSDGFYIDTSGEDEMRIGLEASIPDAMITGRLGFLELEIQDNLTEPTALTGTFAVDLQDPSGGNRLTMSDLGSGSAALAEVFQGTLDADANVNLDMRISFGGSEVFPSLVAQFAMHWDLLTAQLGGDVELGGTPEVAFNNVGVDLGSFISDFAGPILDRLQVVMDPLRPVVDALQTRMPVLSDIDAAVAMLNSISPDEEVSLVELIGHVFSQGEEENTAVRYVEQFVRIYTLLDQVMAVAEPGPGENLIVNIGDFVVPTDVRQSDWKDGVEVSAEDILGEAQNILGQLAEDAGPFAESAAGFLSNVSVELPEGETAAQGQFSFPLFEDPTLAFNLLLGRDVDLARYEMAPLSASFDFEAFYPLLAVLGIEVQGHVAATAFLNFGFDTRGVVDFVGSKDPLDLINGFYIDDRNEEGVDIPEFRLDGLLSVAGGVDAFVARAVVGGEIRGDIEGNFFDVDNDGRFRIDDFRLTFPQCMVDLSGSLEAGAFARVQFGLGAFSVTRRWDIANTILAKFDYSCEGMFDPILASHESDGVLRLHIGTHAGDRVHGDTDTPDEDFTVSHVSGSPGNETVLVSAFGYEQEYTGVSRIVADGDDGNDNITIDPGVAAAVTLYGGPGDDVLIAGAGAATLEGGSGFDELVGSPQSDIIRGGDQDDLIIGHAGNDILRGGRGLDNIYGDEGNDDIDGGEDDDLLFGGADDDTVSGGAGDDELDGDDGDDVLRGEVGDDLLIAGDGDDIGFGGAGDDQFSGGRGDDVAMLGAGNDEAYGGEGDDDIDGGTDDDELFGNEGNDTLRGNAGADMIFGEDGNDEMHGGSGNDQLDGADGNDVAFGDAGDDLIFGRDGHDNLDGGADDDVIEGNVGNDTLAGGDGHDMLFGGDGDDSMQGGSGQDEMWGEADADDMAGGSGNDLMYGGDDNDTMFGDEGDDEMFGEAGADDMDGGAGRDLLEGAAGNDRMHGGPDGDLIIGDQGFDRLFGGWGNDLIYGFIVGDQSSTDQEYIEGGPDDDFICGTDGVNEIYGGTATEGFDAYIDPPVIPDALPGGFTVASCTSEDPPEADFESVPELDEVDLFPTAEIRGRVYDDANGNGIDDAETALGGFQVYVDIDGNQMYDVGEPTDFSDFEGNYAIEGLEPGDYVVRQVGYNSYGLTQPQDGFYEVQLDWGDVVEQTDFGNAEKGSIRGSIWVDINNDTFRDVGEPIHNFVTVYLDLNANGEWDGDEPITATVAGSYAFNDVAPGNYIVRQVTPANHIQTFPESQQPHFVDLYPGINVTGMDFGNFDSYEISGVKWSDINGDGARDPNEPGIAGVTIYIDANDNGEFDEGERSTVTMEDFPGTSEIDETGFYEFLQVPRGLHVVREIVPDGYRQTFPGPEVLPNDTEIDGGCRTVNGDPPFCNFGNQPLAEIHGHKWNDLDGDGGWDEGEPGLGGVTIYLDLNENGQFDVTDESTVTQFDDPATPEDESGRYAFTELPMGTYFVHEVVPNGSTQSYPKSFDHKFEFTESGFVEFVNFGNFQHATVEGFVWNDVNGNGVRDRGETGQPGVVIYADDNGNGRRDANELSTISDQGGIYSLSGLAPGEHQLRQVVPYQYQQTAAFTVSAGETLGGQNFGRRAILGDVTGFVWTDTNSNGVLDRGESGLAGAVVYLDLNGNDVRDPTDPVAVTQSDDPRTRENELGVYEFAGLEAGRYVVRQDTRATVTSPRGAEHRVEVVALNTTSGADFGNGLSIVLPRGEVQVGPALDLADPTSQTDSVRELAESRLPEVTEPRNELIRRDRASVDDIADAEAELPEADSETPVAMAGATDMRRDFGDLPDSFRTTLTRDGARHLIRDEGPRLGEFVDGEPDGRPDVDAAGDDTHNLRDEDGIQFIDELVKGAPARVVADVAFSPTNQRFVYLNGWLDANGDGNWNEPNEHVLVDRQVSIGANLLEFIVPTTNEPGSDTNGAAFRFRVSSEPGLSFLGMANDGEVEDYLVDIAGTAPEPNDVFVSIGDAMLPEGNVGETMMAFEVSISEVVEHPVMVAFETQSGTATSDVDFLETSGHVVIAPGANFAIAEVPIVGELLFEASETFTVVLTGVTAASIGDDTGIGTIENDDSPSSTGEVRGLKWLDLSDDGIRDADEPGLAEFTIYADLNGNGQLDIGEPNTQSRHDDPATPADETGTYILNGVPAGTVDMREVTREDEGWSQTFPASGAHEVMVTGGGSIASFDFGNIVRLPDGDDVVYAGDATDRIFGDNVVEDVVSVGTRQDMLYGEGGNDIIDAQERDDLLSGGPGEDILDGGDDIDRVWQMVDADQVLTNNLLTGQGPDTLSNIEHATLIGGASDNKIDAHQFELGSVILIGNDGDDCLIGTDFDDELNGGHGNDEMAGNDGNDLYVFEPVTSGVAEIDTLDEVSDQQTDVLDFQALPASDMLTVDLSETVDAEFGQHNLRTISVANTGNEPSFYRVVGGAANDTIIGNADDNVLEGNAGNDQINGGMGNDLLDGSSGDDHYLFTEDWGIDQIMDAAGVDHADFSAIVDDLIVNIGPMSVTEDANQLTDPADAIERVTTGSGDDRFDFLSNIARLAFGSGEIDGGPGLDTLNYEALTANVNVNLSMQQAHGVAQVENVESVFGGEGDDMLTGDALANRLVGNGGADSIMGLGGNDTMMGGLGDDTYLFETPGPGESDTIAEANSEGVDTVNLAGNGSPVHVDMTQELWMTAGVSGRNLTVISADMGAANIESVTGTDGNDSFVLAGTSVAVDGGLGNDNYAFPDGAQGIFRLNELAGGGRDTVNFSAFTTSISFAMSLPNNAPIAGLTVFIPMPENFENLLGGEAGDTITGNLADNRIAGNGGNDTINTSTGADVLAGGPGDDSYVFQTSTLDTTITDSTGVVGSDTLDFSSIVGGVEIDLDSQSQQTVSPGLDLRLTHSVENFIGTSDSDVVHIDMLDVSRNVDGSPDFDAMHVSAFGALVSLEVGQVNATGFASILHTSIESVEVSPELVLLPGDADGDGVVGVTDFLVLSMNFGMMVDGPEDGDFNEDGEVTVLDFLILSRNFGMQLRR